jgi:formylglycine-generating enzyme required for sulfatase activity
VGGKIFINYRRKQSLAEAQHLATILAKEFGARSVFIDVRGIDGFSNWFETLEQQVGNSAAMISVIGKDWLPALDAKDYPPGEKTKDFARFEIAEALRRNIPVLPVLLDGAATPLSSQLPAEMQGMLRRQGMKLRGEDFPENAAAIARQLKKLLAEAQNGKGVAPWKVAALVAAAFALGVAAGPAVLTQAGIVQPSSDEGLKAALGAARRERDQAASAKEAAEREASKASAVAASELTERKAAEARLAEASSKLKTLEKQLEEARAKGSGAKAGEVAQTSGDAADTNRAAKPLTRPEETALKPQDEFKECEDCPEMVVIPAGSFTMGSPGTEEGRFKDEGPQHRVTISKPFAAGKYAVTFAEWDACAAAGGCGGLKPDDRGWGRADRPVINVSWYDAQAYVKWLSGKTGKTYRLLSEAEFEYAARAGTETPFWWTKPISTTRANYYGAGTYGGSQAGENRNKTVPVKNFQPNPWGLFQVHGNVWTWTEDCWNDSYEDKPEKLKQSGGAWTFGDCTKRVKRCGSWADHPGNLRAAARFTLDPANRGLDVGLRVARTIDAVSR